MFAVFLKKIHQFVVHFGQADPAECADAVFLERFIVARGAFVCFHVFHHLFF
jgi:hypothetical protein